MSIQRILRTGAGLGAVCAAAVIAERGDPNDKPMILALGGAGVACMATALLVKDSKLRVRAKEALDAMLFQWNESDAFTVRDLLSGGVSIFGRTGSGKTSSSGKALANSIVRYPGSGGLILAAKPEDTGMWRAIFAAAGRSDDLLVFSPDNPLRFNFLDYEMQAGGHTRNITKCITVIGETLRSSDTSSGENADFWQREQERMIFNAVEVVKLATGKVGAPELQKFISAAAMNPGMIGSAEWQAGFHNQCLNRVHRSTRPRSR